MAEICVGVDIGAVTIKSAALNDQNEIVYSSYEKHFSEPRKYLSAILYEIYRKFRGDKVKLSFSGSGGINVAELLHMEFYQEVIACIAAAETLKNTPDIIIDIGGEDSKIVYMASRAECRMNNSCAAGTGAFLEQMADLLNVSFDELNSMAASSAKKTALASRCGVFTKTDIQNHLSRGVDKNDIAAGLLDCVVNQIMTVLACGRKIKGKTGFIGGVFDFLPELKKAFVDKLNLDAVDIPFHSLFIAYGAALLARKAETLDRGALYEKMGGLKTGESAKPSLPPLFETSAERDAFHKRGMFSVVGAAGDQIYGDCCLGIDAGSTTTKIVIINERNQIIYSDYKSNNGDILNTLSEMVDKAYAFIPKARIKASGLTGYGEKYLKDRFNVDICEVETIAHLKAAAHICKNAESVIDAGGQDVKYIKIKNGGIQNLIINEACSSGAGAFLQNFANSLNVKIEDFARLAFESERPCDLGTRCTVFMNSRVRQAQKEGSGISDIMAGLAYSVIKNILNKVIKIKNYEDLGKYVVVQGGVFKNDAVLRAFEIITGITPYRCGNPELMGAYGMALISGEKKSDMAETGITVTLPNSFEYKRRNVFNYKALPPDMAPRGVIGLPRMLNIYENYPFWHTFFTGLGFRVELSDEWTRGAYETGLDSVPSETVCYPAKTVHGHIENLIAKGIKLIFYPCIPMENYEGAGAEKNFNCPVVAAYPEAIKNNMESIKDNGVEYVGEYLSLGTGNFIKRIMDIPQFKKFGFNRMEIMKALNAAKKAQNAYKQKLYKYGAESLEYVRSNKIRTIIVASRPYFIAEEISHKIDELIIEMGMAVLSEDCVCHMSALSRPLRIYSQWTYAARLFGACDVACKNPGFELVQLTAFGCGIDAVTSGQAEEILENSGKIYTLVKLDESRNISSIGIRLRSLKSAADKINTDYKEYKYVKAIFNAKMARKHVIVAPQLQPLHSAFIRTVIKSTGYNLELIDKITPKAIELGLKYVNNDICYPAILVIGQLLEMVLSGGCDADNLTLVISQSGCGCRDSNYISLIRKALDQSGWGRIPVLSFNYAGLEKNPGFRFTVKMNYQLLMATIYSDLLTGLILSIRPYEANKGETEKLYDKWFLICDRAIVKPNLSELKSNIENILDEFSRIETLRIKKIKVAVVGETYLKYSPAGNNNLVSTLENEGCEVFLPGIMGFIEFMTSREISSNQFLGSDRVKSVIHYSALKIITSFHKILQDRLPAYPRLMQATRFNIMQNQIEGIVSHANQNGEGWYLPSKMIDFIKHGVYNIVCIQPFGCLSGHVLGRGAIKRISDMYPEANIMPLDYDASASETNQINRVKMLVGLAKIKEAIV